jgi:hypothetical protein
MSAWTQIVAALDVDTFIHSNNLKDDIEVILKDAPKITGSEGNADVFVNVLSGYNVFTGCDCDRCEHGDTVKELDDGRFNCDADDDYECPYGRYQTRVAITVIGSLRDRYEEETKKEYEEFVRFVDDKFWIRNQSMRMTT